jgi:hypothetical protein
MRLALVAVPLLFVAGCVASSRPQPVLVADVRSGPGVAIHPKRTLALSATCGSVEWRCPKSYVDTVDGIVRGGLEFEGHALIQSDELLASTRARHEEVKTSSTTTNASSVSTTGGLLVPDVEERSASASQTDVYDRLVVLDGPTFEDLALGERQQLLRDAGAEGVLTVRIVVGGDRGLWGPDQDAEVMIKLAVDAGETMAWAARCTASSNDFGKIETALEQAARCAINGVRHR